MQQYGEFIVNHWDLFLALVVIIGLMVATPLMRRLRGFNDVEPQEAVGLINRQDAVLLDVRESNELRDGRVPESVHLALSGLDKNLGKLEDLRGRPVIVGCRSGHRSARAAGILRKNGFEQVYNLRGGLLAWESAGLPLSREKKSKKSRKNK